MATANMGLVLPTVSVTVGPTYATQNNTAFTTIDTHDHTSGKGVLVPSGGININADLPFNSNAATELQKTVFDQQSSALTGTDFLQDVSGELYFNDGSGNQVQLTSGGTINVASAGGFGGDYVSAGASAIYTDSTKIYTFRDGVPAEAILQARGMISSGKYEWKTTAISTNTTITDTDNNHILLVDTTATRTITLPDPTLGSRVLVVKDVTGMGENKITLARNGTEDIEGTAANYDLEQQSYGSWTVVSDGTDWWIIDGYKNTTPDLFQGRINSLETVPNSTTGYQKISFVSVQSTSGSAISESSAVFTFNTAGWYEFSMYLHNTASSSGSQDVHIDARLRNTTDAATEFSFNGIYCDITASTAVGGNASVRYFYEITDVDDNYELQWVTDHASTTARVFGYSGVCIKKL